MTQNHRSTNPLFQLRVASRFLTRSTEPIASVLMAFPQIQTTFRLQSFQISPIHFSSKIPRHYMQTKVPHQQSLTTTYRESENFPSPALHSLPQRLTKSFVLVLG